MTTLSIGNRRADGKWAVTLTFEGGPNAFGGYYPSHIFRKVYTPSQLHEAIQKHGDEAQRAHYTPLRCGLPPASTSMEGNAP